MSSSSTTPRCMEPTCTGFTSRACDTRVVVHRSPDGTVQTQVDGWQVGDEQETARTELPRSEEAPAPLTAPLPGLVVQVCVAPGEVVGPGQRLVVLEAMKMRNVLRAIQTATVREVFVVDGATVDGGVPLVTFEQP